MKNLILFLTINSMFLIFCETSYAVLDDNLGLTKDRNHKTQTAKARKTVRSKNDKRMIAKKAVPQKKSLAGSLRTIKKSLGAVPKHIQENWDSLSSDQQQIVYSYHNENPYAQINKEAFKNLSRPNREYEHDTRYGFDTNQQDRLDDLRADINGATKEELSEADKQIIDNLAALEEE